MVKLLLDRGADVNAAAISDGPTAVRVAAACGHQDVVELLLNNGAGFGDDFPTAALRDRDTRRRVEGSNHWYRGWSIFD